MECLGYYNGEYGELDKMRIPMNDRVCFFGDGVYDAAYSRNYKIFALDEHVDRFFNSARLLDIRVPVGKEELKAELSDMLSKCDCGNNFVYWQATRGTQIRSHAYEEDTRANLWITIKPCDIVDMREKIKLITAEDTRFLHCNIKTLNLIPSVMASQAAKRAGAHETVFHRGDTVTECAHSNIHILKDGALITHPTDCHILAGVARAHLIAMCGRLGVKVCEIPFSVEEMRNADEVIVTSAGSLCLQACEIDGKEIGGKDEETVKMLQKALLTEFTEQTE